MKYPFYIGKCTSIFILFLLIGSYSFAQDCDLTSRNMIKYMGTSTTNRATIVQKIGDNGYVIGGTKEIGTVQNFYLARLDLCGEVLWENLYNDGIYGFPAGITFIEDVIYVSAYVGSSLLQTSLVKFDLDGNVLDAKKFGGNSTYPRRMIELSDGNLVFAGVTNISGGAGSNDFYVTKSTTDGSILWSKQIGGAANDFCHNITETSDGNMLVVGYNRDYIGGVRKGIVMKIDALGNVIWSKEYHNGAQYSYCNFAVEIDGFYYFTGIGNNATIGEDDGLIIKTDSDGEVIWSKFIGTTGDDYLHNVSEKDGVLYVSGRATSTTKGVETIVFTMDFDGNLIAYTSLGTAGDEINSGAFVNFNVETDGFYGVTAGNTGMIGGNDVIFYRFNAIADNCEPSDVALTVIDAGIMNNIQSVSSVSPSWSFSDFSFAPEAVADAGGFICETIEEIPCDPLEITASLTTLCVNDPLVLNATSMHSGTVIWSDEIVNGDAFFPLVGTNTYTVTSDAVADCPSEITIEVLALPNIIATADQTDICIGETILFGSTGGVSYVWEMGVEEGVFFEPSFIGEETYSVTGTDSDGCMNTANVSVTVHDLPVANLEFEVDGLSVGASGIGGCTTNEIQFNDLSVVGGSATITAWNWSFGDGNFSSLQNPTHVFTNAGNYTVSLEVTTANGCTSIAMLEIEMLELEVLTSLHPVSCNGVSDGSINIIVTGEVGALTHTILDQEGSVRNLSNSNTANGLEAGWYDIIVADDLGCTYNETVFITEPAPMTVDFTYSPSAPQKDDEINFTNTSPVTTSAWFWDFGDGETSMVENPIHIYSTAHDFVVKFTAWDGLCNGTVSKRFTVEEDNIFYIPNSFSPDGDAFNNVFLPVFTAGYDPYDYHLTIFNRWGEIIFESYDAAFGWNGAFGNRAIVMPGVYVWQIEFGSLIDDTKTKTNGHVTVIK